MFSPKKIFDAIHARQNQQKLNERMLHVAKEGNRREVKRYLAEGADILAVGENGNTMLHYAAMYGWEDIAAGALKENLPVDVKNRAGETPLLTAASHLYSHQTPLSLIPYLLKNKANANAQTRSDKTALHFVAQGGNTAAAEALLNYGAAINAKDDKKMTPLLQTREGGTLEMAEWLLKRGANITLTASDPTITILHVAAERNWTSILHQVLTSKKVNIEAGGYASPLFTAAKCGHKESVQLLIDHGALLHATETVAKWIYRQAENAFSQEGKTLGPSLLCCAAKYGWDDIVKLCLQAGASIEENAPWQTPLLIAAKHGHKETVIFLLGKNANIDPKDPFDQRENEDFNTLLHYAAQHGWIDIAKQCLKAGLSLKSQGTEHQIFPLLYAAANGQKAMVLWLLDQSADIRVKDCYGQTLLDYAAKHGWKDIVKRYFLAGTDTINVLSINQRPLLQAAEQGHKTTVEWFLKHGAAISVATSNQGYTLLHYAAKYGWTDIAEKCLKAGLSINVKHPYLGDTPILDAAAQGNKDMVVWLLAHEADILIGDREGTTVLHCAATYGWLDIAEKCTAARMSLEQEEGRGYSPLTCAITSGQVEMVAWLIKNGANSKAENKNGLTPIEQIKTTLSIEGKKMTPEKRANLHAIIAVLEGKAPTKDTTFSNENNAKTPERKTETDTTKTGGKDPSHTTGRKNGNTTETQRLYTERNNCNDNNPPPPKNPYFLRPKKEWPESYRHAHQHFRQALAGFKKEFCSEGPFSCYVIYPRGRDAVTEEVKRLVDYLREAGITVHYERERQYTGKPFHEFLHNIHTVDFVIVVGTPSLLQQYHWKVSPENPTEIAPPAHAELDSIEGVMKLKPNAFTLLSILFEQTADVALPPFARPSAHTERDVKQADYFTIVRNLIAAIHGLSPEDSRFKEMEKIFAKATPLEQKPAPQQSPPSAVVTELKHSMEHLASTVRQVQGAYHPPSPHLPSRTLPTQQEIGR